MHEKTTGPQWCTYIVSCADNTFYTGITNNLRRRLDQHNQGCAGAKYTRSRRPVRLVYYEKAADRSTASKREHAIKKLSLADKTTLIASAKPALLENEICSGENQCPTRTTP